MYLALIIAAICFGPWFLFGVNWWSPIVMFMIFLIPTFFEIWYRDYSAQFDSDWEATKAFYKDLFTFHWERFWNVDPTNDRTDPNKKKLGEE